MVKPSSYPAIGCHFFRESHDLHRSFGEVSKLVSKALEERLPIAAASGDFASRSSVVRGGPWRSPFPKSPFFWVIISHSQMV